MTGTAKRPLDLSGRQGSTTGIAHGAASHDTQTLLRFIRSTLDAQNGAVAVIGRFDHITLLPNRESFITEFASLLDPSRRQCLHLISLADARHFNDLLRALGHAYSEDFVRAGAERLANLLPTGHRIFHVSVLSFAFVADCEPDGGVSSVVSQIVAAFRQSIVCQNIPIDTKTGIGVVPLDVPRDPAEFLRAALAGAQDSRRTHEGWAWYDSKSDAAHQRAFRILADLPAAIVTPGQLSLEFQPRVAMRDGACVSAEALLRWDHPDMGRISPAEFIGLAEATALITPLTQWVLRQSLLAAADWQRRHRGLKISINVSPKNLEEPDFSQRLIEMTDRIGVDPHIVELEFTEGVMGGNWFFLKTQFETLRAAGFELAIDDFGSGYSNMNYLGKIPAKYLKIDQAFVRPMDCDRRNRTLVHAIIELAHALDYEVVAEGIETAETYAILEAWGCEEGQGYYMSRPLPQTQFQEWVGAWPRRSTVSSHAKLSRG